MTIVDFFKAHDLSGKGIELRETNVKTYEGTTDKILYINLPKQIEGQDFLVCSRTLASKLRSKDLTLKEACVSHDEDTDLIGLVCPATTKVIETVDLW